MSPQILFGDVMHRRLLPKINGFNYGIYYLALPLNALNQAPLKINRFAPMSFFEKDHGAREKGDGTGTVLEKWARDILTKYNVTNADGEITLICMPRIFGYVFNPVSFWLCHDASQNLRAVICEVNNTFGQTHTYLCAYDDGRIIDNQAWMTADKLFHVSPFLKREGQYKFRFNYDAFDPKKRFGVWIDFYNKDENKQLVTSLIGRFDTLNKRTKTRAFWRYPLVTFKAIALIHWQAVKIITKGIKYIPKPKQLKTRLSVVFEVKKDKV